MRKRLWALLILVMTTLVVVAAVAYMSSEPDWYEATSGSGRYVAEFPEPPTTRTIPVPGSDALMQVTEAESGDIMYGLAEAPMNGADPRPLDETVDRLEASYGGTTEEIARNTGSFEGVETREVTFNLNRDGKKAPTRSLIFYQDGYAVQAVVSADNELDVEAAERFLSSVASRH